MVTQADLSNAEIEVNRAAEAAGIALRFEVINGSYAMGTAYRLESRGSNDFAQRIGGTRAEAVVYLSGMSAAFRAFGREAAHG